MKHPSFNDIVKDTVNYYMDTRIFPNIAEIVNVVCLNRRSCQMDKYGICLSKGQIKIIQEKAIKHYRKDMSPDKLIDLVSLEIQWEESNLNRGTLAMIAEYGM